MSKDKEPPRRSDIVDKVLFLVVEMGGGGLFVEEARRAVQVLTNPNLPSEQKEIAGVMAGVLMVLTGFVMFDAAESFSRRGKS